MLATYHCPLFQLLLLLLLLGKASCSRQLASFFGPLHLVLSVLSVTERKQRKQRIKQRGNGEQLLWHVRRRISQPILFPLHWLIICTVSGSAYPQMANIWSIQWPLSSSSSLPSCPLLHLWISPRLLRFCCYRQAHVIVIWPVQLRCSFLLSQLFSFLLFLSLLRY